MQATADTSARYTLERSPGKYWDISRDGDVVMILDKTEYSHEQAVAYVERYNSLLPKWDIQQVDAKGFGKGWGSAARSEFVDCHDLAREAFGDIANDGTIAMCAMSYLWRRFGPPAFGTDPYKSIAHWMLTTAEPDVRLSVDPTPGGLAYSFRYVVRRETWYPLDGSPADHRKWEGAFRDWFIGRNPQFKDEATDDTAACRELFGKWRYDSERVREAEKTIGVFPASRSRNGHGKPWRERPDPIPRVNQAILDAMRELLRPVPVRDTDINLLGRADDIEMPAAKPSKYAGLGVPLEAMDELLKDDDADAREPATAE